MERIRVGKCIVIGINLIFGIFGCKTKDSYVYNKTTEK